MIKTKSWSKLHIFDHIILHHLLWTQMPVSDPGSSRAFIWLITCLLFISLIAGGACLVAYMVLPETETTSWIPVAGVTLVCLPWAFWFLTFLYRIFSRCCGFRVENGNDGGGGGSRGGGGGNWGAPNTPRNNVDVEVASQAKGGELNRESSVASHESEMPLAKSMASWHHIYAYIWVWLNLDGAQDSSHFVDVLIFWVAPIWYIYWSSWWWPCLIMLEPISNPHHAYAPHEYIGLVGIYEGCTCTCPMHIQW